MNNEEQILQLLSKLTSSVENMQSDISELKTTQATMQSGINDLKEGQRRIEAKLDELEAKNANRHTSMLNEIRTIFSDVEFLKFENFNTKKELHTLKKDLKLAQ